MQPQGDVVRASCLCLTLVAAAIGQAAYAKGDKSEKCAERDGTWTDNTNISAALIVGRSLILGTDECGFLQVGRMNPYERSGSIRLEEKAKHAGQLTEVEIDTEALAYDDRENLVYATGSHSVTRERSDKPKVSYMENVQHLRAGPGSKFVVNHTERQRVYRFPLDPDADGDVPPDMIDRASLMPTIRSHDVLAPFALLPSKENGVDIEGLALVRDDKGRANLYAGFRSPVLRHGFVPVLKVQAEALFRASIDAPVSSELLFVPLDGLGIRDLVATTNGILVLAGPSGDGDSEHRIYWWNGVDCVPGVGGPMGELRLLDVIVTPTDREDPPNTGKAEAILLTRETGSEYQLIVFFDSLANGAPQRHVLNKAGARSTYATRTCGAAKK